MNSDHQQVRSRHVVTAFLSSTSRDLREHRSRVRDHCERFGYGFRLMEEFGAQNGSAAHISIAEIDGCDLFVGVYARRYGYIPSGFDKSVTEMEYDEAERVALPRLVFVIAPEYSGNHLVEANRDDTDPLQAGRLRRFLDRLQAQRVWDTFTTPQHLANRVSFAVSKWEGWRVPRARPARYRYIGRTSLLEQLDSQLTEGARVALVGIGGIGKTITAAEFARRASARFPGGILWVGLGTEARDPEQALHATMRAWAECHHPGRLADTQNLTPVKVRQWIAEAPGRVLVVLDDVWHARTGREVLRLVPERAALLVTTRRGDVARQLGLDATVVSQLQADEAVAFLRDRIGDLPSLAIVRRIAHLLDGHPLALEIVAAQIVNGPPDIAERLADAVATRLRGDPGRALIGVEAEISGPLANVEPGADAARYSSLSAALRLTYDTFPDDLKRLFRATGIPASDAPLSESLLASVWAYDLTATASREEFASRTAALVSAGTLTREGSGFTRHTLLRLFALDAARQAGDEQIVEDRYIAYVLDDVLPRLRTTSPDRWELDLADDLPHVHFVGEVLTSRSTAAPDDAIVTARIVRFAAGVNRYLQHRREVPGAQWLEAAATASKAAGNPVDEVHFLNALAGLHYARRDSMRGLQAAYAAWQLAGSSHNDLGTARAALLIGYQYTHSDPYEAPRYFEGALKIFVEQGDANGQAEALIELAGCDGDWIHSPRVRRKGFARLMEALRLARDTNSRLTEVKALIRLGNLHHTCAEHEAARGRLEEAAVAARELGTQGEEAVALINLAAVLVDVGDLTAGAVTLDSATQLFETVGDAVGRATALRNAAQVAELRGDPYRASQLYATAIPFVRKRTVQELDTFSDEDMRAVCTLDVRLDDVLFNDTREQSRLRLFDELNRQSAAQPGSAGTAQHGPEDFPMPEDIIGFLVRQTIAAASDKTTSPEWERALLEFARTLDAAGASWSRDAAFARALAEIAGGRTGSLPEGHTYHRFLPGVTQRIRVRKAGVPLLNREALGYFLGNTATVRTTAKEKARDWTSRLRLERRNADVWGDRDESELFGALLGLATDHLSSVRDDNAYAAAFHRLQEYLSATEGLLLEYIEQHSVWAAHEGPQTIREYRAKLAESLELATLWRQPRECEFLEGVLAVLDGKRAPLPHVHPYGPSLTYIASAVRDGLRPTLMRPGQVKRLFAAAQTANLAQPDEREDLRTTLAQGIAEADTAGDVDESMFFRFLVSLVDGTRIEMQASNPYRVYLESRTGAFGAAQ